MKTLIHADIFFFITSISVILFTIGGIIVIFYVTKILRDMKQLSELMLKEGDKIVDDIESFRESVKEEGMKIKTIADFFLGLFMMRQKRKNKRSPRQKAETSAEENSPQ